MFKKRMIKPQRGTPNKYRPHQGKQEKARRRKQMYGKGVERVGENRS